MDIDKYIIPVFTFFLGIIATIITNKINKSSVRKERSIDRINNELRLFYSNNSLNYDLIHSYIAEIKDYPYTGFIEDLFVSAKNYSNVTNNIDKFRHKRDITSKIENIIVLNRNYLSKMI